MPQRYVVEPPPGSDRSRAQPWAVGFGASWRPWLFALPLVVCTAGCTGAEDVPDLVQASAIGPRVIESGDQLELTGSGFPEGRRGTLTLEGALHRPGKAPELGIRVVAPVLTVGTNQLKAAVDDELVARLCGRGEDARHSTFRGKVVVAFAPSTPGAAPVTGTVRGVELDVPGPTVGPAMQSLRDADAARFRTFAGFDLEPIQPPLRVANVEGGSRAARAGLVTGDVLLELDGVALRASDDVLPAPGTRSTLLVQRAGQHEPLRLSLATDGFHPPELRPLGWAALLVVVVALWIARLTPPGGRALSWVESQLVRRLQERPWLELLPRLWHRDASGGAVADVVLLRLLPYLCFVAMAVGTALAAFGQPWGVAELDLPIAALLVAVLPALAAVLGAGHGDGRFRLRKALVAAGAALVLRIPALLAVAALVLVAGTPTVPHLIEAQGAWPWQWHVARSPALAFAALAWFAAAVPSTSGELGRRPLGAEPSPSFASRVAEPVRWATLLLVASVGAATLLGGSRLPFVAPTEQLASPLLAFVGAVLLFAKSSVVALLLAATQAATARTNSRELLRLAWPWLALLSLGLLTTTVLRLRFPLFAREVEPLLTVALLSTVVVAIGRSCWHVLRELERQPRRFGVNPWL